jgi:RimJ/RimL family protein N-acetyltransferase
MWYTEDQSFIMTNISATRATHRSCAWKGGLAIETNHVIRPMDILDPTAVSLTPMDATIPTRRLILRRWRLEDAAALHDAVSLSIKQLRPWLSWAEADPAIALQVEFITDSIRAFDDGLEFGYGVFERGAGELVATCSAFDSGEQAVMEIGYWTRSDRVGRGYATEAARALTNAVFARLPHIDKVNIRMDAANVASATVASRAGFTLRYRYLRPIRTPAETGHGLVWVRERKSETSNGAFAIEHD